MDFTAIAKHYIEVILPSDAFLSPDPVKDGELLYPSFLQLLDDLEHKCKVSESFIIYKDNIFDFVETYRSNKLQKEYYDSGLSKTSKNGMHHYGIAVDTIFLDIYGSRTYKGDFRTLHKLFEGLGGPDLGNLEKWDAGHLQYIRIGEQDALRFTVKTAVIAFQNEHGLDADGIAGPITHKKAKEVFA